MAKLETSLLIQQIQICLPIQGTQFGSLVQEDSTCYGATNPVHHMKPVRLEPVLCNKRSHCSEKPVHCNAEYPPLTTTRESPRTAVKTQCNQKYINKVFLTGRTWTGPPIWTPHHTFLLCHPCCYECVPWILVNWQNTLSKKIGNISGLCSNDGSLNCQL